MNELPTTYNIFWQELRMALVAAGATLPQYLRAITRLKDIEATGRTGYLNSSDPEKPILPYVALGEYIGHMVGGGKEPEWLTLAEKGHL